ncbi:nucleoside triphosphate pyrophosphohydrolase/pyrophosphatase MazG [bacterium BMS3Abin07]|nr:nucleoside triphosphate pyrophosphohydrolase/pyrophosphatase MazG [bacterium BMS3Abin07]GBE33293.1 nucleoside triphosphate pyrophosphohydrolase/pyrophosphatase MazG [bacterium BMS3Bbin05]HDO21640.1 nucleoside triphosphate pyrophosphohydrolase [Nitrospirota bacterium]HDZ87157.1 nucleoside triphosphate pyrophosphohydrolase [Nitrospirota bacterium]
MNLKKLVEIMSTLRAEDGCPWDREQTRESLKPFLIEETYEVIEAIDEGDSGKIKEELGDLLFQIIFHAQIGKEKGEFDINDVIERSAQKMIARHPHVFGDEDCGSSEEVLKRWDDHKRKEGKLKDSILDGVPGSLPSLLRAHRLQERVSRVGFDWEKAEDILRKLDEEISEFREALQNDSADKVENELGDIFFVLVNISRFAGVDPENALRRAIGKFVRRFRHIEMAADEKKMSLSEMSLNEMNELWESAKKGE